MTYRKKLIEVALPLEAINEYASREKSIRHGHPSTLHLWWSRKPLAAARTVIFSSLVDDPSSHPEKFPTEEEQAVERERLFALIEELVKWENSNNPDVIDRARAEILRSTDGNPPPLLDPFAGGGAIPLEAQRLGLEAHASDLNPVAVMINKAMIEIPPKFVGLPPVNPEAAKGLQGDDEWKGARGLADDVRYYGEWMKQEAFKKIGHLYPKVKLSGAHGNREATVIAWKWARTVKCPNPACGAEMPLVSSWWLSKKKGKEAWVEPIADNNNVKFTVRYGKCPAEKQSNKLGRGAVFQCPICGATTTDTYIKQKGEEHNIGARLMAIVASGDNGRIYVEPSDEHERIAQITKPDNFPTGEMPNNPRWFSPPAFGMKDFSDLFTPRQLTALTTFSDLVREAQQRAEADAVVAGMSNDKTPLTEGGTGAMAYGQAVGVYLAFAIDRLAMTGNSLVRWNGVGEKAQHCFGRQALPMLWDYAEPNFFAKATGSIDSGVFYSYDPLPLLPVYNEGFVAQAEAQNSNKLSNLMISTDPPYYDNIGYADLSDFFYVWLRRTLRNTYPQLFNTMLVPKNEELVATPYRFDGSKEKAKDFFESGMLKAFQKIHKHSCEDVPVTIYYAFKQSETSGEHDIASTGWETMLSAIIQAGFSITGTWPIRTEMKTRQLAMGTNALASSIVLVCRKRPTDAPISTRRDFINTLKRELKPALAKLQESNIAPVDLAQSAIGPGMAVYSRYSKVLEADGKPMGVRNALQIINQELDAYFSEQEGTMDSESRFCIDLFSQYAFNEMKFGDADVLARAKNTSVEKMSGLGLLRAQKGVVRLLTRGELPDMSKQAEDIAWLLTQQLVRAMETGGVSACADIVAELFGANEGEAKALAYRLYTIAERKGWASEAFAYNSLVIAWPEITAETAQRRARGYRQTSLEFE